MYRTLVENLPAAVAVCDSQAKLVYASRQFSVLFGANSSGELIGIHGLALIAPEDKKQVAQIIQQSMSRGAEKSRELPCRRLDGSRFMAKVNATTLRNERGEVDSLILIVQDITERKQAEDEIRALNRELDQRVRERTAELEASNRELESFAYSVSHDLRAPLRAIDGFCQALMEDYHDQLDAQGRDYLDRVSAAARRMARLIDDLLEISRVTRKSMRRERVDLSALAREIAGQLREAQPERDAAFIIGEGVEAFGDPLLLRLALDNLLNNAFKFTTGRPRALIEFGAREQSGQTAYFVGDNGVGFDMAYADNLFVPFQRLHTRSQFPGSGIGLATVQRIVHRHGGRVWGEGRVDRGATFYFTLIPPPGPL